MSDSDNLMAEDKHEPSVTLPEGWMVSQVGISHVYMEPTEQDFRTRVSYDEAVFYVGVHSFTREGEHTVEFREPNEPGVHEDAERVLQNTLNRVRNP